MLICIFLLKKELEKVLVTLQKYSKANSKYCPDYDKEKPEKYIICLDMNNLYGHAMSQN